MQGINVFASTAARDAAITSPQEGQFAYTKDTNSLWYYTGSAWAASGATGDIEGVTAGIGISGGGTSGTVTVTNSMATAIDAKGDLIAGTAADTFDRLAVGTNGQTLVADSSTATGLKWATASGGGKVLQVVNATYGTVATNSTASYADTGLTATITPTLSTSKILVIVTQAGVMKTSGNSNSAVRLRLMRGATELSIFGQFETYTGTALQVYGSCATNYLDSPATTSATTYKTQFANVAAAASANVQADTCTSSITLLEIGA
jgi:hypothetical protein